MSRTVSSRTQMEVEHRLDPGRSLWTRGGVAVEALTKEEQGQVGVGNRCGSRCAFGELVKLVIDVGRWWLEHGLIGGFFEDVADTGKLVSPGVVRF